VSSGSSRGFFWSSQRGDNPHDGSSTFEGEFYEEKDRLSRSNDDKPDF
jgi:hypothetical protein